MKKYKLSELKNLVKIGAAIDITNYSPEALEALENSEKYFDRIGVSRGTCGMNGGLLRGHKTGSLYVIVSRNSNLFRLF